MEMHTKIISKMVKVEEDPKNSENNSDKLLRLLVIYMKNNSRITILNQKIYSIQKMEFLNLEILGARASKIEI